MEPSTGLLECSYGMAAGSPRVSDPREESKEEATVPFMSSSGKSYIVTSTTFYSFTKYSLHSREGELGSTLEGKSIRVCGSILK